MGWRAGSRRGVAEFAGAGLDERDEILELMAFVLAHEIDDMLKTDRPFNNEWYETALRALPELPPEK